MTDDHFSRKTAQLIIKNKGPESPSPFVAALDEEKISVGQRLREIRGSRGLSMKLLAQTSGLNINTLSLIENERTSPSVSTLQQLAQSLQVPITEFFESDHGSRKLVHQKQGKRPRVTFQHSIMEDLAPGMPRFGAEPIIVILEPVADSGEKPIVHTGREFVYCLDGRIVYTVDNENYLLESGDSLIFDAYLPHHWKNIDSTPSRALLVLCPMDERDQPKDRHFAR
jgi:transcriptional regulator with XRE-family HTH domain